MAHEDYYQLLGLSSHALPEEIKHAFRLKARQCHPDVVGDVGKETFHTLQNAYNTLIEPESRARYDALRAVEAAISQVKRRRQTRLTRFHHFYQNHETQTDIAKPVRATFVLTIEEALYGAEREFWVERWQKGKVSCKERVKISIAPGWSEQSIVQTEGINEKGQKRSVHLSLKLEPYPDCDFQGHDIYFSLFLYPWEMILGGKWVCPLFREQLWITVPADSQPDRKLRAKGLGLPKREGGRGDLWVILKLRWPSSVSEVERGVLQKCVDTFAAS